MTIHRPPPLATWILKRLGSPIVDDALVGDLFEEYQTRRSPIWYWRQVGAAIGVGASRDVWHHLPVAVCAIVIGLFVAGAPVWFLSARAADSLSDVPIWIQSLTPWAVVFGSALLSGWVVSLLFRAHRAAAVLSLAVAIVIAGAILLQSRADLSPAALGSLLLLDALAAVGGGSLIGVRARTVRG